MILLAALSLLVGQWAPDEGEPIAGPWRLLERVPGYEGSACIARSVGPDANTDILLNNVGEPILIAARRDWAHRGEAQVSLTIDADVPRTLTAQMVANLVMVRLSDPALVQRLKTAKALEWTMPFGRYRTDIAQFGAALDAMRACKARAKAPQPKTSS